MSSSYFQFNSCLVVYVSLIVKVVHCLCKPLTYTLSYYRIKVFSLCAFDLSFVDMGFASFLPHIAESLFSLLESGADTEPEIIEQVQLFLSFPAANSAYLFVFVLCLLLFFLYFIIIILKPSFWISCYYFNEFSLVVLLQIFTSWSYIMMYLQKYLINNLVQVLK